MTTTGQRVVLQLQPYEQRYVEALQSMRYLDPRAEPTMRRYLVDLATPTIGTQKIVLQRGLVRR